MAKSIAEPVRFPLEGEQCGDVHSVPRSIQDLGVFALDERDMIPPAERTVISGKFHQAQRRILVWVARLDEQNTLVFHFFARLKSWLTNFTI